MTCIDFVESNSHCSICNRTIKTNIAILHNDMILGRTCAKNQNINLLKIPNLTKGLINDNEAGSETESSTKPSSKTEEMIDKKSCKEYLMLRCDKLSDIKSSNYVADTLEAVIWVLLKSENYKEAVIGAINLGEDTDTIGALTGAAAGIVYGYDFIPEEWKDNLAKKDYLMDIIEEFSENIYE